MQFWQALIIAGIPSVAAVLTAALGFRDLGMRRRLETSRQFLNLFALAHGRPVDGRDRVGLGEQIATVHLIADFAKKEQLVRNAAKEGLRHLTTWASIDDTQQSLLSSPPEEMSAEVVARLQRLSSGRQEIASAATEALQRLEY